MRTTLAMLAIGLAGCTSNAVDTAEPDPVALVTLDTARADSGQDRQTIYGAAEPAPGAEHILASKTDAVVDTVLAPLGSHVSVGYAVLRLRPSPAASADAARARADAAQASAALARAKRLRADGLVSDADVETAQAAADTARAALASASGGEQILRSPVSGSVTSLGVAPGELLAAGATAARIGSARAARAHFGIDPAIAARVSAGAAIRIAPASGGPGIGVRVASVDLFADPQTRLASLYADLPGSSGMSSGAPLRGEVAVGPARSSVSVDYGALLSEGGQPYLFVVASGVAHRRNVVAGPAAGDRIAITRGVKAGEQVVVEGGTGVEDGMKVRTARGVAR